MISDKIIERIEALFFFSLITLCISFGLDFFSSFFLHASGLLGLSILILAKQRKRIEIDWTLFIPVLFFAYLVITPGNPLKDLYIAGIVSSAFFAGVAGWLLFHDKMHTILFALPASLVANFLFSCLATLASDMQLLNASRYAGRLTLTFTHPNILGELSALGIFFLLCFPHPNRTVRNTGYGLMAILSAMIVLSVGRSSYLGMASAILVFAVMRSWKKAAASILVLLTVGCALFPFMPDSEQERIVSAFQTPLNDRTFKNRLPIWGLAYQKITEAPIFGHGLRTFKTHYQEYFDKNHESLKAENPDMDLRYFRHPHSIYLATIYVWGIAGTALLAACWAMAVRYGHQQGHHLMLYVTAFMLAFGFFEVRFLSRDGAFFLFFPIGMAFTQCLFVRDPLTAISMHGDRSTP
jgi:O-antigen ligase